VNCSAFILHLQQKVEAQHLGSKGFLPAISLRPLALKEFLL